MLKMKMLVIYIVVYALIYSSSPSLKRTYYSMIFFLVLLQYEILQYFLYL